MTPSIFFNLPSGKICRITKAELLARDRERDAELERTKQEMSVELEKMRQEMAELKAFLSRANISSPVLSDKASCEANGVQQDGKLGVARNLVPLMVDDDELVPSNPIPPESKVIN